jgi:hypothetical protein
MMREIHLFPNTFMKIWLMVRCLKGSRTRRMLVHAIRRIFAQCAHCGHHSSLTINNHANSLFGFFRSTLSAAISLLFETSKAICPLGFLFEAWIKPIGQVGCI